MCICVYFCVEDEEKGKEREKREKGRVFGIIFSKRASAAVPLNGWSKSGSWVACAQISQAGSAIAGLRALKILLL